MKMTLFADGDIARANGLGVIAQEGPGLGSNRGRKEPGTYPVLALAIVTYEAKTGTVFVSGAKSRVKRDPEGERLTGASIHRIGRRA
jgi:hypothetical protein